MSTLLKKARKASPSFKTPKTTRPQMPEVVATSYTSLPVTIPDKFLAPLHDPSTISVQQIDFKNSAIPEYQGLYAVVLENVLSRDECDQLIHFAEQSAGAHRESESESGEVESNPEDRTLRKRTVQDNGWKPAMINAGPGKEYSMIEYRNSDRIVWDHEDIAGRIWRRCLQAEGIKDELSRLQGGDGSHYDAVLVGRRGRNWKITENGLNERLRFLKYGGGQYFREHCDGQYRAPEGSTSFYTLHLYLNDSVQALKPYDSTSDKKSSCLPLKLEPGSSDFSHPPLCLGGATSFHSRDMQRNIDVDPKVGRVLIFQQQRLLHSGADVTAGTKYTMRSDLMYDIEEEK